LGVPRNATYDDIKKAYRKLAIKYHPKNNADNQDFNQKFIEVNEAFNALKDELRRKTYDDMLFGQITPLKAHNIFDDFFGRRLFDMDI
jgi:curved DNA-binding protein CbpA